MAPLSFFALTVTVHIAFVTAADIDLASTSWAEPSRTEWCPVHAPFSISNTDNGVTFKPPQRGAFSLAETSATLPSDHDTVGLRLKLSASSSTLPSFWRVVLRMSTGGSHRRRSVRFISPVEVPSGGIERTVFLPWTSFNGQKIRRGGIDQCSNSEEEECIFKPEKLGQLSLIWARAEGIEEPTLTLHEVVATSSTEVGVQETTDGTCSCEVDCVHCLASDWTRLVSNACSSSTTWDMCLAVRQSLSKRAIGALSGSCTLSGAADALRWLSSSLDVSKCAQASPSLLATLLGDVLHGVLTVAIPGACSSSEGVASAADFVGPFVGWGITGHNDLGYHDSETVESCLKKCREDDNCKSVDYGARDTVQGECWLSTADRFSAASSYSSRWVLYDYYEKVGASANGELTNAASMADGLSAELRTELLAAVPIEADCCADPANCITKAIDAGVPAYSSGDTLGCFVIYHAAAERLGKCSVGSSSWPDARGMMEATAKTAESDTHTGNAAWRLRYAFDVYLGMLLHSDPEDLSCKKVSGLGTSSESGANAAATSSPLGTAVRVVHYLDASGKAASAIQGSPAPTPSPALRVVGSIAMDVTDPSAFVVDVKANTAISKSLAGSLGVDEATVSVRLSAADRRQLASVDRRQFVRGDGADRRLSGAVHVDYEIAVVGQSSSADALKQAVIGMDASTMTATIAGKLVELGASTDYGVAVTSMPTPSVVTNAASLTPGAPAASSTSTAPVVPPGTSAASPSSSSYIVVLGLLLAMLHSMRPSTVH